MLLVTAAVALSSIGMLGGGGRPFSILQTPAFEYTPHKERDISVVLRTPVADSETGP